MPGEDLLEEHLVEIRSLCQRLEESICTNDRFREQLERCLAFTGKASGTVLQGGQGRRGPLSSGGGAQPSHTPLQGCTPTPCTAGCQERDSAPCPFAGLPSDVYAQGSEPGLQLSRENQALREDNRTLRLQCDHLSQGRARPPASPV